MIYHSKGCTKLLAAVIVRALKDTRSTDSLIKDEAYQWIQNTGFEIAEDIGLNRNDIAKWIKENVK